MGNERNEYRGVNFGPQQQVLLTFKNLSVVPLQSDLPINTTHCRQVMICSFVGLLDLLWMTTHSCGWLWLLDIFLHLDDYCY